MTAVVDPEGNETTALFDLVDLHGRRVLEIGCGDGRLTWLYAGRTAHVTALDPFAPAIARAQRDVPRALAERVRFVCCPFREFEIPDAAPRFDVALLSWSLCCMRVEEMGPALEHANHLIRPGGVLIDIHPRPRSARIEVRRGHDLVLAEPVSSASEGERDAEVALANAISRGLFDAPRWLEFDMRIYAESLDELRSFLAEADAHAAPTNEATNGPGSAAEEPLESRIRQTEGVTQVAYYECARITRLRRVAAPEASPIRNGC